MKKTDLYLSFEELYHDANKIGLKLLNSEHTIDIANFITEVKHLTFKPDLEGKYQIDASNPLSFMQPSHLTAINKYLKEIKERKPESEFINEGNKVIARIYFFKWLSEKYKITPPSKVTRTGTVNSLNEIVIISSEDSVYNNFFTLDIYKEFLREYNQTKKIELINHEAETIKNELYVGIRKENDSQGQDDSDDKSRTKTPQKTETKTEQEQPKKFIANEYALAYIFDLYATGKQIPINITEGGYNKSGLIEKGYELYKYDNKKDTFYRAVKHVVKNYDLNNKQDLMQISIRWNEAVKELSKDWCKTEEYLIEKKLIGE